MSGVASSLYNLKLLDNLARKDTAIHRLHPLAKLLAAIGYLIAVLSYDRYDIIGLLPLVFYPVFIFTAGDLPAVPVFKRVLLVLPVILGIGLLNPVFDRVPYPVGGIMIARGWITFASLSLKCCFTVSAGILLIATTGMDKLAAALRIMKVPKIFVLQLLLTYRYISILMEEISRMIRAYSLRAPGQKGIHRSAWGSFAGQWILRTFERAQRVYVSMTLRGFDGEYHTGGSLGAGIWDIAYLIGCTAFFITARVLNIPELIGTIFTGVFG